MREALFYSVVSPFLVTVFLLLVGVRPQRRRAQHELRDPKQEQGRDDSGHWSGAVAFAAAFLICHLGVHGWLAGSQLEAWEWLLLLAPLAALLGVVDSLVALPARSRLIAAIALAAATGWLIVPTFQEFPWGWRLAIGATVLVLYLSQRSQSQHLAGIALPLTWILVGACGLPVLIASANAKFGFFSTSVAAAAGATLMVCNFVDRNVQVARSAIPVVSLLFPAIFFSGHFNDYGEVPLIAFALLITAPFGLWVGVLFQGRQPRSWTVLAVGMASVVAVCAASLYLTWPAITAVPTY